jgi:hypothetical protein
MRSVRAIYEGNNIHFFDDLEVENSKPQFVIITFVDKIETDISKYLIKYSVKTDEIEISNYEIQQLLTKGKSFDFLNAVEEDIYSDEDLKIKY